MSDKQEGKDVTTYQVTPNEDLIVVLYERFDTTGMKRTETAIVKTGATMGDLKHIQAAFDAAFEIMPGDHSVIKIKRAHTVLINPEGEEGK